jgi:hypothetical protein
VPHRDGVSTPRTFSTTMPCSPRFTVPGIRQRCSGRSITTRPSGSATHRTTPNHLPTLRPSARPAAITSPRPSSQRAPMRSTRAWRHWHPTIPAHTTRMLSMATAPWPSSSRRRSPRNLGLCSSAPPARTYLPSRRRGTRPSPTTSRAPTGCVGHSVAPDIVNQCVCVCVCVCVRQRCSALSICPCVSMLRAGPTATDRAAAREQPDVDCSATSPRPALPTSISTPPITSICCQTIRRSRRTCSPASTI